MTKVVTNFKLLPQEIMVDLVNKSNPDTRDLDLGEVIFSNPELNPVPATLNSRAVATAVPSSNIFGSTPVFYDRVYLTEPAADKNLVFWIESETRISDILDQINERFGTNLQPEDYFDDNLPVPTSSDVDPVPFLLRAHPDSLIWLGQVELSVGVLPPDIPDDARVNDEGFIRVVDDGRYRTITV